MHINRKTVLLRALKKINSLILLTFIICVSNSLCSSHEWKSISDWNDSFDSDLDTKPNTLLEGDQTRVDDINATLNHMPTQFGVKRKHNSDNSFRAKRFAPDSSLSSASLSFPLPFGYEFDHKSDISDDASRPTATKIDRRTPKKHRCPWQACNHNAHSPAALKIHTRKHTGEKPYKCNEQGCTYTTTSSSNLTRHKIIHTDEKPYKCNQQGCTYTSITSSNLARHKITHADGRPYKCDRCGFATDHPQTLRSHKATHTDKRPHTCDKCGFSTNLPHALTSHKTTHNPIKIALFTCKRCGYKAQVNDFEQHIKKCK